MKTSLVVTIPQAYMVSCTPRHVLQRQALFISPNPADFVHSITVQLLFNETTVITHLHGYNSIYGQIVVVRAES